MPYIPEGARATYDRDIERLLDTLAEQPSVPPGEINYIISRLIWGRFNEKPSYTRANELVGVLECVKQEFIRRKLNDYEDDKIRENGDLKEGACEVPD